MNQGIGLIAQIDRGIWEFPTSADETLARSKAGAVRTQEEAEEWRKWVWENYPNENPRGLQG